MFSFFSKGIPEEQLGVVLDINSNEVTIAILLSKESENFPQLLWHHQEVTSKKAGVKSPHGLEASARAAIEKAFSMLSTVGLASLRRQNITKLPDIIQVSISAPFSYTVSRNMKLSSPSPFKVTSKIIDELKEKASAKSKSSSSSRLMINDLSLVELSNSTAGVSINGYSTQSPLGGTAKEFALCQIITLASKEMDATLKKQRDKVLPHARLDMDSFMSLYLRALAAASPKTSDVCFMNVTDDYVEMMVVRDSVPQSSTFSRLSVCLPETITMPSSGPAYQESLTDLFRKVGDGLAMPRTIFVHSKRTDEASVITCLETAAKAATGISHRIVLTNKEFFAKDPSIPPFLATVAFAFHKDLYEDRYLEEYRNVLK